MSLCRLSRIVNGVLVNEQIYLVGLFWSRITGVVNVVRVVVQFGLDFYANEIYFVSFRTC